MRVEFPQAIKDALAKRVGVRCSNPSCRKGTSGPQENASKAVNVGVAAHIAAAAEGGPRFDSSMTPEEVASVENGIWLCQNCAKLIDNDEDRYTPDVVRRWKTISEAAALRAIEMGTVPDDDDDALFLRLEQLMPNLLDEMREDLANLPLRREFVLLEKSWSYNSSGHELVYYFDDHPELVNQVIILENYGLVGEVTHTNVKRYRMSEAMARYLGA